MTPMPEILLDTQCRFWEKVDHKSDSECWNWLAGGSEGYGQIKINGKTYRTHRISYYIHYKKDPGELLVCHKCNNKLCVNPNHLFLGTESENMQHAFATGRHYRKGILQASARLTEQDVRDIRELRGEISQAKIAKLFGVSCGTIQHIMDGRNWSHVA